ncbi:hypothetical protein C8F01DRAFT_1365364 [Mycena amicta]|nr:hypothetical protein C8F01DRAFT_1365364 [Mycena amicta]
MLFGALRRSANVLVRRNPSPQLHGYAVNLERAPVIMSLLQLPDDFYDWYKAQTGDTPRSEVLTHCRRELLHTIWCLLLDGKFMEACKHGIVIVCPDGMSRRFFFHLFTYSADYPEKVLLATTRSLGKCPCLKCTIPSEQFHELGTVNDDNRRAKKARVVTKKHQSMVDRARYLIYRAKKAIKGPVVKHLLQPESWVPTKSAFFIMNPFTWDMYRMLVPDLMHEFELGVWIAVFIHLIRILFAHGGDAITNLNLRYRLMPTFGRDTIRRFSNNTSAMKKLAARDYEDILQCSLPVFENLLDEEFAVDNEIIQDLLFAHAYWHGLAKLRMHTTFMLACLKEATRDLGYQLRRFARTTCKTFVTKELPREEAARRKQYTKKLQDANRTGAAPSREPSASTKIKTFNGNTIKTHFLGEYVPTIPFIGTSDSYSMVTGELEHKRGKAFYGRTSKNDAITQISNLERREAELTKIAAQVRAQEADTAVADTPPDASTSTRGKKRKRAAGVNKPAKKRKPTLGFAEAESLSYTPPDEHPGDPAFKNFRLKLQTHLLGRIHHPEYSTDGSEYTTVDRNRLFIVNNRIYIHKVLCVHYTSYDVRHGQDSMNSRTHADIMTLAPEDSTDDHPYAYSRVIGVWHCEVQYMGYGQLTPAKTVPLLFVRRFHLDKSWKGSFKRRRLHRIEFVPETDDNAYGFVNPDKVIREAHLVPAYAHGATPRLPFPSLGRKKGQENDWRYYYVNFFVDRDMLMRYLGGGVGHSYRVIVRDPPKEPEEVLEEEDWGDEPEEPLPAAAHAVPDVSEDKESSDDGGDDDDDDDDDGNDAAGVEENELDGEDSEEDSEEEDSEEESDDDYAGGGGGDGDGGDGDSDSEYLGPEDGEDGVDDRLLHLASGSLQ